MCLDITPTPKPGLLQSAVATLWGAEVGLGALQASQALSGTVSFLGLQATLPHPRVCAGADSRGTGAWQRRLLWAPSLSAEPPVVLALQAPQFLPVSTVTVLYQTPWGPRSSKSSPKSSQPRLEAARDYTLNGPEAEEPYCSSF